MANNVELDMLKKALMDNPKYDSDWIDAAASIIYTYGDSNEFASEKILSNYSAAQLVVLSKCIKFNAESPIEQINIAEMCNRGLNATQMQLIFAGFEHGLTEKDMEPFMDPNIPYAVSNFLIKAILEGHSNAVDYIHYTPDQVHEIYAGLSDGVDVSAYADKDVPAEIMGLVRHCMNIGMEVEIADDNTIVIKKENKSEE